MFVVTEYAALNDPGYGKLKRSIYTDNLRFICKLSQAVNSIDAYQTAYFLDILQLL